MKYAPQATEMHVDEGCVLTLKEKDNAASSRLCQFHLAKSSFKPPVLQKEAF